MKKSSISKSREINKLKLRIFVFKKLLSNFIQNIRTMYYTILL